MKKSRNKYIGIFSCFVLAAVFAVTISVNTSEKDAKNNNEIAQVQEEENLASIEEEVSPVIISKNASEKEEEDKEAVKEEPKTEKEETADTEEKTTEDYTYEYDESKETVLSEDSLTFAVPVSGTIAMDYSKDKLVYDATLDQYRTNESICYSAAEGTVVGAAAQGTVESITTDRQNGTSVTVFHGDGWRTTYSQLSEDVAVAQGDIIEKGQTIGYVGAPSSYSAALGSHLEFTMTLDGNTVDPKTALVE